MTQNRTQFKRQHKDFELQMLDNRTIGGDSADYEELSKMKKKPLDCDDPIKSKYEYYHFFKKICRVEGSSKYLDASWKIPKAIDEVRAQEFLRLMMPTQPKGRIYFDDSQQVYVASKVIPGFISLDQEGDEKVAAMLSNENYGTERGLKGLGELYFYSWFILKDSDFQSRNLGYSGQQLYKIDGGQAFRYSTSSWFLIEIFAALENHHHPVFTRELFCARLKFMVLPDILLQKFSQNYNVGTEIGAVSGDNYFKLMRNFHSENIVFHNKILQAEFKQYILSNEASNDINEYKKYLMGFKLQRKKRLLDECPNALQEIDDFFLKYRKTFRGANMAREEKQIFDNSTNEKSVQDSKTTKSQSTCSWWSKFGIFSLSVAVITAGYICQGDSHFKP